MVQVRVMRVPVCQRCVPVMLVMRVRVLVREFLMHIRMLGAPRDSSKIAR